MEPESERQRSERQRCKWQWARDPGPISDPGVEATRARGRFALTLTSDGWRDDDRTSVDELLLTTAP